MFCEKKKQKLRRVNNSLFFFSLLFVSSWMVCNGIHSNNNGVFFAIKDSSSESGTIQQGTIDTNSCIEKIVRTVQEWQQQQQQKNHLPFITITYAQTLDGMIGFHGGSSNIPISSHSSLLLTHGLRSIHSAILVGGNTLLLDNPRLTNRLYHTTTSTSSSSNPQAIVLDTNLHYIRQLLLQKNHTTTIIRANPLWVCCSKDAAQKYSHEIQNLLSSNNNQQQSSNDHTIHFIPCDVIPNHPTRLDIPSLLQTLKQKYNIQSIMVEGGSSILSTFLSNEYCDALVLTICPKFFGSQHGLPALSQASFPKNNLLQLPLHTTFYSQLGPDWIVCSSFSSK